MRHLVISDTQVKGSSASYDYLECAGHYAAEKKPDVIIHIGDHFDMESLSSYDKGTGAFEGRRYKNDIEAMEATTGVHTRQPRSTYRAHCQPRATPHRLYELR